MKSMWIVILPHLIEHTKGEKTGPLISVIVDQNPVYCLEGESVLLPVAIVGTAGKQVYWWSPIDNHLVWMNGVAGKITDYQNRAMSFHNGSLLFIDSRDTVEGCRRVEIFFRYLHPLVQQHSCIHSSVRPRENYLAGVPKD